MPMQKVQSVKNKKVRKFFQGRAYISPLGNCMKFKFDTIYIVFIMFIVIVVEALSLCHFLLTKLGGFIWK